MLSRTLERGERTAAVSGHRNRGYFTKADDIRYIFLCVSDVEDHFDHMLIEMQKVITTDSCHFAFSHTLDAVLILSARMLQCPA